FYCYPPPLRHLPSFPTRRSSDLALGFQRLEPLVHRLQVVAQPHTAHAGRGDREPALSQLVGNADLTEGRLLNGKRNDGVLDLLRDRKSTRLNSSHGSISYAVFCL